MIGIRTGVQLPPPGTYTVDPDRSSITFTTRHMFGLGGVTGSFAVRDAEIVVREPVTRSTVTVEVDAASFDTGSTGRDDKVRSASFLDVHDHPTINFVSTSITHDDGSLVLSGVLTVRGHRPPWT